MQSDQVKGRVSAAYFTYRQPYQCNPERTGTMIWARKVSFVANHRWISDKKIIGVLGHSANSDYWPGTHLKRGTTPLSQCAQLAANRLSAQRFVWCSRRCKLQPQAWMNLTERGGLGQEGMWELRRGYVKRSRLTKTADKQDCLSYPAGG